MTLLPVFAEKYPSEFPDVLAFSPLFPGELPIFGGKKNRGSRASQSVHLLVADHVVDQGFALGPDQFFQLLMHFELFPGEILQDIWPYGIPWPWVIYTP